MDNDREWGGKSPSNRAAAKKRGINKPMIFQLDSTSAPKKKTPTLNLQHTQEIMTKILKKNQQIVYGNSRCLRD